VTQPAGSSWLWERQETPQPTTSSRPRRIVGRVLLALGAAVLVAFTLGFWNPSHYVHVQRYFGNPFAGAVIFFLLVVAGVWLLLPVRSEAAQGRRQTVRWLMLVPLVLSLIGFGLCAGRFTFSSRVVAHSPSGQRSLALVTGQGEQDPELHVWAGHGLTTRDLGGMGRPCGINVTATFKDENTVHVTTVYGDHDLHLDPATGHPRDALGRDCTG
jgi:hypothetical protein